jgi:hypothetical protein
VDIKWLTARVDEDEAIAREGGTWPSVSAQLLREVEFKRAILAWCAGDGLTEAAVERGDISAEQFVTSEIDGQQVLRMMAKVYEDRPGYAEAIR